MIKGVSIFIDSAKIPANSKSSLGSSIKLNFDNYIDVNNKYISVKTASIYYVFPNIQASSNNTKIKFIYDSITRVINLPVGLYSVPDINESISEQLTNFGLSENLLYFQPDEATSLMSLLIKAGGIAFSLNCNDADNILMKNFLGFTTNGTITTSTDVYVDSSHKIQINTVNDIYVKCNVSQGAIFNSDHDSNYIAKIPINVKPSSLIQYEPILMVANRCIASNINSLSITLVDENENELNMNGEEWSMELILVD